MLFHLVLWKDEDSVWVVRSSQTSSLGNGEPGEVRVNLGKAVYTSKILATGKPQTADRSEHRNMNVFRYEGRDGCNGRRISKQAHKYR